MELSKILLIGFEKDSFEQSMETMFQSWIDSNVEFSNY